MPDVFFGLFGEIGWRCLPFTPGKVELYTRGGREGHQ